jgi:hypothetical protein
MTEAPGAGVQFFWHRADLPHVDEVQALLGPELAGTTIVASVLRGGELRELEVVVGVREGA